MHWRVTRPNKYGTGTPGFSDSSARQGYYVDANTRDEAMEKIRKQQQLREDEKLEVELWGI